MLPPGLLTPLRPTSPFAFVLILLKFFVSPPHSLTSLLSPHGFLPLHFPCSLTALLPLLPPYTFDNTKPNMTFSLLLLSPPFLLFVPPLRLLPLTPPWSHLPFLPWLSVPSHSLLLHPPPLSAALSPTTAALPPF